MKMVLVLISVVGLYGQVAVRIGTGTYSAGEGISRVALPCGGKIISALNGNGALGAAGVGVMDISNPNSPTRVNVAFLSGGSELDAKAFTISPDCRYAFMGPLNLAELTVWDLSAVDGTHIPNKIATLAIPAGGNPYWAEYYSDGVNNYIWMMMDTVGMVLVDVTTPASPAIVNLNGAGFLAATMHSFEVLGTKLYGCSETAPSVVTRLDFTAGFASITTSTLSLNSGENQCKGEALAYPYMYNSIIPSGQLIVTVDMSTTPPTRIGAMTPTGTALRHGGVKGSLLFFPSLQVPCLIDVLSVATPTSPVEVQALTFNSGENNCRTIEWYGSNRAYIAMDSLQGSIPGMVGVMAMQGSTSMSGIMSVSGLALVK